MYSPRYTRLKQLVYRYKEVRRCRSDFNRIFRDMQPPQCVQPRKGCKTAACQLSLLCTVPSVPGSSLDRAKITKLSTYTSSVFKRRGMSTESNQGSSEPAGEVASSSTKPTSILSKPDSKAKDKHTVMMEPLVYANHQNLTDIRKSLVSLLEHYEKSPPKTESEEQKQAYTTTDNFVKKITEGLNFTPEVTVPLPKSSLKEKYLKSRQRMNYNETHNENVFITATQAMSQFLLPLSELDKLPNEEGVSAYTTDSTVNVKYYKLEDVSRRALEVYGSIENLENKRKEVQAKSMSRSVTKEQRFFHYLVEMLEKEDNKVKPVVQRALLANVVCTFIKALVFAKTGSTSMFSETIHSLTDCGNQFLLLYGFYVSQRPASPQHPYGHLGMRNVTALISGAMFLLGAGLSCYQSATVFLNPEPLHSWEEAISVLSLSFACEFWSVYYALKSNKPANVGLLKHWYNQVFSKDGKSNDPLVYVVLMEDTAAILGNLVAAVCYSLSYYTEIRYFDALGSWMIAFLLTRVAFTILSTNTEVLMGLSMPEETRIKIRNMLHSDPIVKGVYDDKCTTHGGGIYRYKAEVAIDGSFMMRLYLDRLDSQDLIDILQETENFATLQQKEAFYANMGKLVIKNLGPEIDRLEKKIMAAFPEIRHVDLEVH